MRDKVLLALKCALADLEGIMPEFEPSGDREHPGWTTIEELKEAIKLMEEEENKVIIEWCWEDIQSLRPEWDVDKCNEVLGDMRKYIQDFSVARGWDVIDYFITDYDEKPEGGLKVGDKVWWTDPDNDECSSLGTILKIKGEGDSAIITILEEEAGEAEVLASELRFVSRKVD